VTLFASGDSRTDAELRAVLPRASQDDPASDLYLERELDVRNAFEAYDSAGEFDVIHAHWPTPAAYFSAGAACPTLLTFDYMEKNVYAYYRNRFPRLSFACVSRAQADALDPSLPVVENGIDVDRVPFRGSPGAYLLTVGRLVPSKGAAAAIEIAGRAGLPLVIVGDVSPYLPGSRRFFESDIAPRVDGERVIHHPRLPNRRVLELMSGARAFLFPIDWEEPFGLVVAEAMAAGAPVVATPRGALPELVEEGVTGWLGDTIADLVAAVARAEKFDRRRCRDRARARFGHRRMAAAYERLYFRVARPEFSGRRRGAAAR
jgi:glycosyltransferase involved in cell wall biosynthesis